MGATCAIAILDLPKGSSFTLNGQSIVLQRDDFVGIHGIPESNNFSIVIARAAACGSAEEQRHGNVAAVSVGFYANNLLYARDKSEESALHLEQRWPKKVHVKK